MSSLITVTDRRSYSRTFDHDECRRLRAEDPKTWTFKRLAEHFGVSKTRIDQVLHPAVQARTNIKSQERLRRRRAPCKGGCGRLVWPYGSGFCPACAGRERTTSARPDELRCCTCRQWKPDQAFSPRPSAPYRRGRDPECKTCAAARKRERRRLKKGVAA